MQEPSRDLTGFSAYECPSCGQAVTAAPAGQNLLQCPTCGEQFFIVTATLEAAEESRPSAAPEAEISELRIREVMHARQAIYRSRRWPIAFAAASLMAVAKFVQIATVALHNGERLIPAADLLAALIALFLAIHFTREVLRITRQIRSMHQPDPTIPPDFSTLSDGSQHWKNLEKLSDTET